MNTYSIKYNDEELHAMATSTMRYINENNNVGMEIIMTIAAHTRMHPQQVIQRIRQLYNIQI